ncbi:hypothetical protein ACGFJT_35300 [Actinomadura geliboluensis]|uniref:hypothetical protein n=1 Tax=Actinomadura geliboluensis TaxID=882440 RepID=UPI00371DDAC5
MQMLGGLVVSGCVPAVAWALVHIVRDVLAYLAAREESRANRELLRRIPDDQLVTAIRALKANRPSKHK